MGKYSGTISVSAAGISSYIPTLGEARQREWQDKVLYYANKVPEVAGAASLVRNSVKRVQFKNVNSILQMILCEFDLAFACELQFLTSESYLVYTPNDKKVRVYSHKQLRRTPTGWQVLDAQGKLNDLDNGSLVEYVYRPSRENTNLAWNPHAAVIDVLEALYTHQLADNAIATSRMATSGVFVWPTTLESKPLINGQPHQGSQEELLRNFGDALRKNVSSMSGDGSYAPFVQFVDLENADKAIPQLVRIERDDYADNYAKRIETYRLRYASGIDLPIEQVTGISQANNWAGYMIRDDSWKVFIGPMVIDILCGLRKLLHRAGIVGGDSIEIDPNDLVTKPDNSAIVMRLLQLENIDPAYALELLGLDATRASHRPDKEYSLKQMNGLPTEYIVGGERGDRSMNNQV